MPSREDRIVAALTRLMEQGGERPMFVLSIGSVQVVTSFREKGVKVVQEGDALMVCRPDDAAPT